MVRVFGDGGSEDVEQLEVHQLASTLQSFTTHAKRSCEDEATSVAPAYS